MDGDTVGQRIGRRVKALRDEKGWSLRQLAEKTGMNFSSISRIENGQIEKPTWRTVRDLARAFKVKPDDLTGDDA